MIEPIPPTHAGYDLLFLRQGAIEIIAPKEKVQIFTPLGSCVSCTIFHPAVGTILTHAKCPLYCGIPDKGHYADSSTLFAIEYFLKSGISPKKWQVGLFGGGIVTKREGKLATIATLGWQNVVAALEIFYANKILLSYGNFGGFGGRKLRFWADTGHITIEGVKDLHGGIAVETPTPVWLLLNSMRKRLKKIQHDVTGEEV